MPEVLFLHMCPFFYVNSMKDGYINWGTDRIKIIVSKIFHNYNVKIHNTAPVFSTV